MTRLTRPGSGGRIGNPRVAGLVGDNGRCGRRASDSAPSSTAAAEGGNGQHRQAPREDAAAM